MDLNLKSNGGNYSAVNGFAPRSRRMKGFGNFANSNQMSIGKPPTKKQIMRKRKQTKARILNYKQNMGKGK